MKWICTVYVKLLYDREWKKLTINFTGVKPPSHKEIERRVLRINKTGQIGNAQIEYVNNSHQYSKS